MKTNKRIISTGLATIVIALAPTTGSQAATTKDTKTSSPGVVVKAKASHRVSARAARREARYAAESQARRLARDGMVLNTGTRVGRPVRIGSHSWRVTVVVPTPTGAMRFRVVVGHMRTVARLVNASSGTQDAPRFLMPYSKG